MIHSRFLHRSRKGFTLMELLLAIGILGVLATGVIVAINPSTQLGSAQNAKRKVYVRQQEKAVMMYMIDKTTLPASNIPTGKLEAAPICRAGVTDPTCVNLDLLAPEFVVALPLDVAQTEPATTGYRIYQDNALRAQVCNDFLPADDPDACAGNASAGSESSSSAICCSPPPSSASTSSSPSASSTSTSLPSSTSSALASSVSTAASSSGMCNPTVCEAAQAGFFCAGGLWDEFNTCEFGGCNNCPVGCIETPITRQQQCAMDQSSYHTTVQCGCAP